jgi:hypothetical protein
MDREVLRQNSANRRTDTKTEDRPTVWKCTYCSRDFQTETWFMRHRCHEKEKLELLQSPIGQMAYALYSEWMKKLKRSVPPAATFLISKQFNYFIKFAEHVKKIGIPYGSFIDFMVQNGIQPVLWCKSTTYEMFTQWYENIYPPEQQFIESIDLLHELCRQNGCETSNIYETLGVSAIAKLVRQRKLSPWLLITSTKFKEWVTLKSDIEKQLLSEAIDFVTYSKKLSAQKNLAREFEAVCAGEGL